MSQLPTTSTRPYFIRAIYEWCTDNGFTPHLAVYVDENVQVPLEYVKSGEIVLNISFTSTGDLELENDYIRFQARFAGVARQIIIPVDHVTAIYARENGQGMVFAPSTKEDESIGLEGDDHEVKNKAASASPRKAPRKASSKPPALHLVGKEGTSENSPDDDPAPTSPTKAGQKGNKAKKPTLRIVD